MAKKKESKIKETIIGVLIVILVYLVLGTFFNYLGMKIYFTDKDYTSSFSNSLELKATIQNNAPITLPFFNDLFYYGAEVVNGNVSCNLSNNYICGETIIDLKKINSGSNDVFSVFISTNEQDSFEIQLKSYLNLFNIGVFSKNLNINCTRNSKFSNIYFCESH